MERTVRSRAAEVQIIIICNIIFISVGEPTAREMMGSAHCKVKGAGEVVTDLFAIFSAGSGSAFEARKGLV